MKRNYKLKNRKSYGFRGKQRKDDTKTFHSIKRTEGLDAFGKKSPFISG